MHGTTLIRYADHRPLTATPWLGLAAAAAVSIGAWQAAEAWLGRFTHPSYGEMLRAAHAMQAATQVARAQRMALGLMQPRQVDPNRTGLLGSEYTDTTTSLGDPAAKRTAANPDLAAALVRRIADLGLPGGSPVLVVVSGSFIGGDIAAIVAVEALGLEPVIVSSLGASMFGATDPRLTWLDIESELRARGIIRSRSIAALIGGGSGTGGGLGDEGVAALREAARRNGVPMLEGPDLGQLLDQAMLMAEAVAGPPLLLVNSGGSVAALGTCADGHLIPPAVIGRRLSCADGIPGLIVRASGQGMPVLHLLNMRGLAHEWGLPFDPVPLPVVGNNPAVYGMPPGQQEGRRRDEAGDPT